MFFISFCEEWNNTYNVVSFTSLLTIVTHMSYYSCMKYICFVVDEMVVLFFIRDITIPLGFYSRQYIYIFTYHIATLCFEYIAYMKAVNKLNHDNKITDSTS